MCIGLPRKVNSVNRAILAADLGTSSALTLLFVTHITDVHHGLGQVSNSLAVAPVLVSSIFVQGAQGRPDNLLQRDHSPSCPPIHPTLHPAVRDRAHWHQYHALEHA